MMGSQRYLKIFAGAVFFGFFILLACDGRLHWDEPSYLYTGAYLNLEQILEGEYQPTAIDSFYMSRILHVLFIHLITSTLGTGLLSFNLIILCYIAFLAAFLVTGYKLLKELLPESDGLKNAGLAMVFSPIVLYFCFKTMPEIPALFFSSLACYSLIRALKHGSYGLLVLSGLSIALTALTKNTMLFMYIGMVAALFICPGPSFSRIDLVKTCVVSGVISLVFFALFLLLSGINLEQYLGMTNQLAELKDSYFQKIFHAGLEGGIFWLVIPLSLLILRKTSTFYFLMLWFFLTTIPLLVLIGHAEARYFANNIIPFTGLAALLVPRLNEWFQGLKTGIKQLLAGITVVALLGSNLIILQVMAHELQYKQFNQVISRLDDLFGGAEHYSILLPWSYTDFHYLRFAFPEHNVYSVHTIELAIPDSVEKHALLNAMQEKFIGEKYLNSTKGISSIQDKPIIYIGFNENFSVANLRSIFDMLPLPNPLDSLGQSKFLDHRSTSWLWNNPDFEFSELFQIGHYHIHQVQPG